MVWPYFGREDGHIGVDLEQRVLVTMVREFVRDGNGIDPRLDMHTVLDPLPPSLAYAQSSSGQNLNLAGHVLHLCNILHGALDGVPLLREPPGNIRLRALQPRVDEDVVVYAAAVFDGRRRARNLQQPRGVGV